MKKTKACKKCLAITEEEKCPFCGSSEFSENFKGRIIVLDPEHSEIAKKLNITKKGIFAIKI